MDEIKYIKLQLLKDYPDLTPRVLEFFDYYLQTNKASLLQVYDAGKDVGNTIMREQLKNVLEGFIDQDKLIEAENAKKALLKAQASAHDRNVAIGLATVFGIIFLGLSILSNAVAK